jgi:membrane protein YqaA with SNARE-associated domain
MSAIRRNIDGLGWFAIWGGGVTVVAGISIVPYWLFTITAGAMDLSFVFFVMAALASRGIRFYLVAWAAYYGGEKGMSAIRRNIDGLGWFAIWGGGVTVVAGISIVPYWLFTITAGAMDLSFVFFVMAALASRGIRFYLVAWAAYYGGEKGMSAIRRNIDGLGWLVLILFVLFVIFKSI